MKFNFGVKFSYFFELKDLKDTWATLLFLYGGETWNMRKKCGGLIVVCGIFDEFLRLCVHIKFKHFKEIGHKILHLCCLILDNVFDEDNLG